MFYVTKLYCILFILLFTVGCLLPCHNLRKNIFTDNTKLKPGPSIRVCLHGYRSAQPRASPTSASSRGVPKTLQHWEVGIRMTSCLCRPVSDQGCPPYLRVLCRVIDLPCHRHAVTSASVWPPSHPLITAPLNPCHSWVHKAPHRFQRWRKERWIVEFRVCFTERVWESEERQLQQASYTGTQSQPEPWSGIRSEWVDLPPDNYSKESDLKKKSFVWSILTAILSHVSIFISIILNDQWVKLLMD